MVKGMGIKVDVSSSRGSETEGSCWASIPPELLRDILKRVEESEHQWPRRKSVVACSGVCSTWREVTKDLVRGPEFTGKLTFPVSLKQPGSRDAAIQCFIRRDRTTHTYSLYLGLPPSSVEGGKFLLAARKSRHVQKTDYVISLDDDDFNKGSTNYMGKLRSNFLGTKFTIFDCQPPANSSIKAVGRTSSGRGSKQVSPKPPLGSFPVASISYELNVLGTRGPRRMQATLHSVPSSALEPGGFVPYPLEVELPIFEETSEQVMAVNTPTLSQAVSVPSPRNSFSGPLNRSMKSLSVNAPPPPSPTSILPPGGSDALDSPSEKAPLVLKNKCPRWHEQLQCWCLNFRGRVTVASVKNFQLVAAGEPAGPGQSGPDLDKQVLLQFGKVGNDMFTMDYRYPLSAFQAFAICLSSFDTKLACE